MVLLSFIAFVAVLAILTAVIFSDSIAPDVIVILIPIDATVAGVSFRVILTTTR